MKLNREALLSTLPSAARTFAETLDNQRLATWSRAARIWNIPFAELLEKRAQEMHFCTDCRQWMSADRQHFTHGKGYRNLASRCIQCHTLSVRRRRRLKAGTPLDAPPRSGRRPWSNTYAAQWQRNHLARMTPEQRDAHYQEQRQVKRAYYHKKGGIKVIRAERQMSRRRAVMDAWQRQERLYMSVKRKPPGLRSIEESRLMMYHEAGRFYVPPEKVWGEDQENFRRFADCGAAGGRASHARQKQEAS